MVRRVTRLALLFAGLAPLSWALVIALSDPRRAALLAAIGAIGIGLNAALLARARIRIRFPLRFISCGVLLVVAGGVMAYWQWLRDVYVPRLPQSDLARRAEAAEVAVNLIWIAASLGYLLLCVLTLPPEPREAPAAAASGATPTTKGEFERRLQKARHYRSRRKRDQSSR